MNKARTMIGTIVILFALAFGASFANGSNAQKDTSFIKDNSGAVQIIDVEDLPTDLKTKAMQNLKEEKDNGYIVIEDGSVFDANSQSVKDSLIDFDELQGNTTFKIKIPTFSGDEATLVGGIPNGPTENGPWNSITLVYSSLKGNFTIDQWDMSDGSITFIEESVVEEIGGQPAAVQKSKLKKSGRDWYSIEWVEDGHYYRLAGNVSPGKAKKIANSLTIKD